MEKNKDMYDTLSSGEIYSLWAGYQYESIHRCGIIYFLQHIEDEAIKELLEAVLEVSNKRLKQTEDILLKYDQLIPQAFGEGDMNLSAPRLFSDTLYLHYVLQTIVLETSTYSEALKESINEEILEYFHSVIKDTLQLETNAKDLAKEKGVLIPGPTIPKLPQVQFVKKDNFLAGWFGEKRPLLGSEISQLVSHARRNSLGQAVITAFSQVAKSEEVRRFFERGREISGKHLDIFTKVLHDEYLPNPSLLLTSEVTDSKEAPFSDKLMTVFITDLIAVGIGGYGLSASISPRRDLGLMYTRLIGEIAKYSNDGFQILIKNSWLEQPPMAADRKDLAK